MLVLENSVFSTNEILFMILTYIRLGFASARFRKISNFFTGVAFLFRAGLSWLKCSLPSHLLFFCRREIFQCYVVTGGYIVF